MSDTPPKNELEAFYEGEAYQYAIAKESFEKRIEILWKVIIGEMIVFILMALLFGALAGGGAIGLAFLALLLGAAFAALVAAVLAYTIGLIPFKHKGFNYSDRRFFWFLLFLAIEGALIIVAIFLSAYGFLGLT